MPGMITASFLVLSDILLSLTKFFSYYISKLKICEAHTHLNPFLKFEILFMINLLKYFQPAVFFQKGHSRPYDHL